MVSINPSHTVPAPKYAPSKTMVAKINAACLEKKPDYREIVKLYKELCSDNYKNTDDLKERLFDAFTAPLRERPARRTEYLLCLAASTDSSLTAKLLSNYRFSFQKGDFHWALRDAAYAANEKSAKSLLNFHADPFFTNPSFSEDVLSLSLHSYQKIDPTPVAELLCKNGIMPKMEHLLKISNLREAYQLPVLDVLLKYADPTIVQRSFEYLAANKDIDALKIWEKHHHLEDLPLNSLKKGLDFLNKDQRNWAGYTNFSQITKTDSTLRGRLRQLIYKRDTEQRLLTLQKSISQQSQIPEKHARTVKRLKKDMAKLFGQISNTPNHEPIILPRRPKQKYKP